MGGAERVVCAKRCITEDVERSDECRKGHSHASIYLAELEGRCKTDLNIFWKRVDLLEVFEFR
jgi:hypothetical protein